MNCKSAVRPTHLLPRSCRPLRWSAARRTLKRYMSTTGSRDYNDAISALNTLQSNLSIIRAIWKSGKDKNKDAIPEMQDWCRRIGYEPSDLSRINAIHIAGTKGKGSTSAFISSILAQYRASSRLPNGLTSQESRPLTNVGLYTSPHLRSVRERIQIDDEPISEELFARYFFEVWDRVEAAERKHGPHNLSGNADRDATAHLLPTKPVYFRFLTLMAFHTYLSEGVNPAVIECGIGGEYDSTNILTSPAVSAITSLGIDHTAMLGETIEEIAWHKAGIFKPDSKVKTAYTAPQPDSAMRILEQRAADQHLDLILVPRHEQISNGDVPIGLAADFQKTNASLAIAVASAYLRHLGITQSPDGTPIPTPADPSSHLPAEFRKGLAAVRWAGRCEVRVQGPVRWHLDGGHTMESVRLAGEWFGGCMNDTGDAGTIGQDKAKTKAKRPKRVLLFNQQTRDAKALARALYSSLRSILPRRLEHDGGGLEEPLFDYALFCTNVTFAQGSGDSGGKGRYKPDLANLNGLEASVADLTVQRGLADVWRDADGGCEVCVYGTIEEAIRAVRAMSEGLEGEEVVVLVTGSLHLVGGVLEVLDVI